VTIVLLEHGTGSSEPCPETSFERADQVLLGEDAALLGGLIGIRSRPKRDPHGARPHPQRRAEDQVLISGLGLSIRGGSRQRERTMRISKSANGFHPTGLKVVATAPIPRGHHVPNFHPLAGLISTLGPET